MLSNDFLSRRNGLSFYGLTPPKRGLAINRIQDIATRQMTRIESLAPDGLILYDLQDEAGRTLAERPFPFLPTIEPIEYARDFLSNLSAPKIFYKCVANLSQEQFQDWMHSSGSLHS